MSSLIFDVKPKLPFIISLSTFASNTVYHYFYKINITSISLLIFSINSSKISKSNETIIFKNLSFVLLYNLD